MLSPAPALADNWEFTELWVDPTASPPYVLMLLCDEKGHTRIYDPAEKYQEVFTGPSYQAAKLWLLEDEYERVEGQLKAEKIAS
jgi:hypothetical protein